MKKLIFILGLVAALVRPACAQFKGTNGVAFGNASSLGGADVFIIGRPGTTNYNLRASNVLSYLSAAGFNAPMANTLTPSGFSTNITVKNFWIMDDAGVGTETAFVQTTNGFLNITPDAGIVLNGEFIYVNLSSATNLFPSGLTSTNAASAGLVYVALSPSNGYWGVLTSGSTYTNNPSTSLGAGKISGSSIGTNIAWSAVTGIPTLLNAFSLLSDPNADRLMFWDDSAGAYAFLSLGTGLTISGTTISASGGSGGSQTPWLSDIEGNNFGIVHSSGIGGRDDANGAALVLFSEDTDASITLYNYSTGFGIRYASTYGHTFTGPVAFNGNTTFYGSNYVDDLYFIALSSATQSNGVAYFNAAGELVKTNLAVPFYYKSMHPKAAWTATDGATRYWGEYDDSTAVLTNAVWKVPFAVTATKLSVKVSVTGTLGSAETVAHQLFINGATVGLATTNAWNLAGPNWFEATGSVALAAGDVIALKVITPTFVTDPTGVRIDWTVSGTAQ